MFYSFICDLDYWPEESWSTVNIEANSETEAIEKLLKTEFDYEGTFQDMIEQIDYIIVSKDPVEIKRN